MDSCTLSADISWIDQLLWKNYMCGCGGISVKKTDDILKSLILKNNVCSMFKINQWSNDFAIMISS